MLNKWMEGKVPQSHKKQVLLRKTTKYKKLWRAMIDHVLKGDGTHSLARHKSRVGLFIRIH